MAQEENNLELWQSVFDNASRRQAEWCLKLIRDEQISIGNLEGEVNNIIRAMGWTVDAREWSIAFEFANDACDPVAGVLGRLGWWSVSEQFIRRVMESGYTSQKIPSFMLGLNLSVYLYQTNRLEEARQVVEGVLNASSKELTVQQRVAKIAGLLNLGVISLRSNRLDEAQNYFLETLELARTMNAHNEIASALIELGRVAELRGNLQESIRHFREALPHAEQSADRVSLGTIYNNLGGAYIQLHEYEDADKYLRVGLNIRRQDGNRLLIANTLVNLSTSALHQGNLAEAFTLSKEAEGIYQRLDLQPQINTVRTLLFQMSQIYEDAQKAASVGDFKTAEKLLYRSLDYSQAAGDHRQAAAAAMDLGMQYRDQERLDLADKYLTLAVEIDRAHNSVGELSASVHALGTLRIVQDRIDEAMELLTESLHIDEQWNDRRGVALSKSQLGQIYQSRGEQTRATELFHEALGIFEEIGDRENATTVQRWLEPSREKNFSIEITSEGMRAFGLLRDGQKAEQRSEFDKARHLFEESLTIARDLHFKECIALASIELGKLIRPQDPEQALQLYVECIENAREVGFNDIVANAKYNTGTAYLQLGKADLAEMYLRECISIRKELQDKHAIADGMLTLTACLIELEKFDEARITGTEAQELYKETDDTYGQARVLANFAAIEEKRENRDAAIKLWDEAGAIFGKLGAPELEAVRRKVTALRRNTSRIDPPDPLYVIAKTTVAVFTVDIERREEWFNKVRQQYAQALSTNDSPMTLLLDCITKWLLGDSPERLNPSLTGRHAACWSLIVRSVKGTDSILPSQSPSNNKAAIGATIIPKLTANTFQEEWEELLINERYSIAEARHSLAQYAESQNNWPEALSLYHQLVDEYASLGNKQRLGLTKSELGSAYMYCGEIEKAAQFYNQALIEFEGLEDQYFIAVTKSRLANIATRRGEWAGAQRILLELLPIMEEIGDPHQIAGIKANLASTAMELDDLTTAEARCHEAITALEAVGDLYDEAICKATLASIALKREEWAQAAKLYHEALPQIEDGSDRYSIAATKAKLSIALAELCQFEQAKKVFQDATSLFRALNATGEVAAAALGLAISMYKNSSFKDVIPLILIVVEFNNSLADLNSHESQLLLNALASLVQQNGLLETQQVLDEAVRSIAAPDQGQVLKIKSQLVNFATAHNDFEHAEVLNQSVLDIAESLGQDQLRAVALARSGDFQRARGKKDKARACYKEALQAFEKLLDNISIISVKQRLGNLLIEENNWTEEEALYWEVSQGLVSLGNLGDEAGHARNFAKLLYDKRRLTEAATLMERAVEIDKKLQSSELRADQSALEVIRAELDNREARSISLEDLHLIVETTKLSFLGPKDRRDLWYEALDQTDMLVQKTNDQAAHSFFVALKTLLKNGLDNVEDISANVAPNYLGLWEELLTAIRNIKY